MSESVRSQRLGSSAPGHVDSLKIGLLLLVLDDVMGTLPADTPSIILVYS